MKHPAFAMRMDAVEQRIAADRGAQKRVEEPVRIDAQPGARGDQPLVGPSLMLAKPSSAAPQRSVAPPRVRVGAFDLHHANASRDGAFEELLLLEKHLKERPCPNCMNKHAITARGLMREASGLDEGRPGDVWLGNLIETVRLDFGRVSNGQSLRRVKAIRSALGRVLGYDGHEPGASTNHDEHDHDHDHGDHAHEEQVEQVDVDVAGSGAKPHPMA